MEVLMASAIGLLTGAGVYLILRPRTFSVIFGLTLVSYAVNLYLLATGRVRAATAPILGPGTSDYADPLPQALVLTAIVIGFGMTAFLVVLALRARITLRTDHVDGRE